MPPTYDDVMFDWAVTELLSPTFAGLWDGPTCEELRTKLKNEGIGSLGVHERTWLIGRQVANRRAVVLVYGPFRSWSFRRVTFSREELSGFSIIHQFGYPSFSLGQFSEKIRKDPSGSPNEPGIKRNVELMLEQSRSGKEPHGLPIAISREPMPPLLIEGYKRAMVALWAGHSSIEMYLCTPPAAERG